MWANNETGLLTPIAHLAKAAHAGGALFHTDATQAFGRIPRASASCHAAGVDFASLSGHKFHAPKGVGALYARSGPATRALGHAPPLLHGGEHMAGLRAGTLNVPGAVGIGAAAACVSDSDLPRIRALRDRLEDAILSRVRSCSAVGARDSRVANTSLLTVDGVEGEALIYELDRRGVCASTGSACASGSLESSAAVVAVRGAERAHTAVRFSLSRFTTQEDVDFAADAIEKAAKRLRSFTTATMAL
jgi:cysteine desulfurase